jgi:two-component system, OmpR family, response regulator
VSTSNDILLIEDDLVVADVLRRLLIRASYTVRVVTDGIQALAALDEELPAILILDLILPGVNGFTILEHIHEHQMLMPIIIITANPLYHDSLHDAGIRHVLIKPFHIEELLAALRAVIGFS